MVFGAGNNRAATLKVGHQPERPREAEIVRITARGDEVKGERALNLQYQVVEPGAYIALADAQFKTNWISLVMKDEGRDGDEGDGIFTAQLPGSIQVHRRLVRYRITKGTKVIAKREGWAKLRLLCL